MSILGSNKEKNEVAKIEFFIPILPPSTNAMYGRTRSGMVYEKPEAKDFKKTALLFLPKNQEIKKECALSVTFNFSNKRGYAMRDLDNLLKVFIDSLQLAGLIKNDRLLTKITAQKTLSGKESVVGFLESL